MATFLEIGADGTSSRPLRVDGPFWSMNSAVFMSNRRIQWTMKQEVRFVFENAWAQTALFVNNVFRFVAFAHP